MSNPELEQTNLNKELEKAINTLNSPHIGFEDPLVKGAAKTVYRAVERGDLPRQPCQGTVECDNGQTATVVFPTSHTIYTRRGIVIIFRPADRVGE